jgi:hypothetical protein
VESAATWAVSFGDIQTIVTTPSASDAIAMAISGIRFACLEACKPCPKSESDLSIRLLSGFPEMYEHELIFGQTVLSGDCFPSQFNSTYRIIRSKEALEDLKSEWPFGVVCVPPFRAHTNSPGDWTIPSFNAHRDAFSRAVDGYIELDRKAGRRWE